VFTVLWLLSANLHAAGEVTPAVARGMEWLATQVQPDGSLKESATTLATPLQAAAETMRTLRLTGQPASGLAEWVAADDSIDTELIARQIQALGGEGRNVAELIPFLTARQHTDGGFPALPGHESNPLDTAFAIAALSAAGQMDLLPAAVAYLGRVQFSNGAYGVQAGSPSVYVTTLVSAALQRAQAGASTQTQVARANAWLRTMQQPDGSWGTVLDTGLVKLALAGTDPDAALAAMLGAVLGAAQSEDGSWSGDAYLTAIALRALMTGPALPPAAPVGAIRGRLVNAVTSAPVAGATVTLQPASAQPVTTDAAGEYMFNNLPPGAYALSVAAEGFAARTLSIQVRGGIESNAGALALQANVSSGELGGTITDRANGLPLAGALIAVDGASTGQVVSAVDGSYNFPSLSPGAVTIRITKTGYQPASAVATVAAGTRIVYSTALQSTPTSAILVGRVADSESGLPLAGVTVRIAGLALSALTDAGGGFTLSGVPAGAVRVELSIGGYAPQTFSVVVEAGVTVNVQTIPMYKTPPTATTGTISGAVTAAADGTPLAGVTILVRGSASASATTGADGRYVLSELAPGNLMLTATKEGYVVASASANLTAGDRVVFSPSLELSLSPRVSGRVIDRATLVPVSGATVSLDKEVAGTDADGRFTFGNVVSGEHLVKIDAPGYLSRVLPIRTDGRNPLDMPAIELAHGTSPVTISGRVTDQTSGRGIDRAVVTVLGAELAAVADTDGRYRLEGVAPGTATIRFSATGYIGETVILDISPYNEQPLDHTLQAGQDSSLALDIETDQAIYPAYAPVAVAARVTNSGTSATSGTASLSILDAQGNYIDGTSAMGLDSNGTQQSLLQFPPGETRVTLAWDTAALPPGRYTAMVRIHRVDSGTDSGSIAMAQRQTGFDIEPTSAIASVRLTPMPGYSYLGASEKLGYRVDVVNRSNVPVSSRLGYHLTAPDQAPVDSGEFTLELAPAEATRSFMIAGASVQFQASGSHAAGLRPVSGVAPVALAAGAVNVAPATRVTPSQSVTPATVAPDGDRRIHVELRLMGVQQK
jgi:hypothetical protein